jgi:hypothetical protein
MMNRDMNDPLAAREKTERNAEIIRHLFAEVEHRDPPEVLSLCDESVVINEAPSLPCGGEYSGPDAVLRRHSQVLLRRSTPRAEPI